MECSKQMPLRKTTVHRLGLVKATRAMRLAQARSPRHQQAARIALQATAMMKHLKNVADPRLRFWKRTELLANSAVSAMAGGGSRDLLVGLGQRCFASRARSSAKIRPSIRASNDAAATMRPTVSALVRQLMNRLRQRDENQMRFECHHDAQNRATVSALPASPKRHPASRASS